MSKDNLRKDGTPNKPPVQRRYNKGVRQKYINQCYIAQQIALGRSRETIIEYLIDKGYSEETAKRLVKSTMNDIALRYELYKNNAAEANIKALLSIIDATTIKENYSAALKAIDLLNKMAGAYTENLNVNNSNPIIDLKIS